MFKNTKNFLFAFVALVMMFSVYGVNSTFANENDNIHLSSGSINDLLCFQLDAEDLEDEQVNCADRISFSINRIISPTILSNAFILSQPQYTFLQPPKLLKYL